MPKDTKRFNKRAVLALRLILVAITLLVAAGIYVAVTDEPVNTPQPMEEVKHEDTESTQVFGVPAADQHNSIAVSNSNQPAVADTACLLVKAEDGKAPDVLHIENTIRIPARLCISFILGITEAVSQGLLDPEDMLYEPML
ncbi:MAG: hypothetical protein Tp1100MES1331091_2 [Prokaryotic dsDNA virus sp.]|nr:MAG: hypothetical protein Tp1100MES1331091_2 [Prokaryotic dsDNA virus sp.]|tara:strand:+ start:263 stop:685 length:423 start_codon:yes stop_codon:yes gene_type:complete